MEAFVTESKILRRTDLRLLGDRRYREFEIAGAEDYEAGQYLMIRTNNREVGWPYPYFIHRKTEHGLVVLAREDQDLCRSKEEDRIEYWGPRGTSPLAGEESPVLIAEPAVYFAVYPFVCEKAYRRLILVGQEAEGRGEPPEEVQYCREISEAAELLDKESGPVIAALNPKTAEVFAERIAAERKKDIALLVTNKKACGIDGCKGCYLHSSDLKFGINVCCKGPFMPLHLIDFEADGHCFETYL